MSAPTFQPRIVAALAAAFCALLAASLLLTGAGERRATGNLAGSNSFSRSAVGHLGLFEMVKQLGHRAIRSEHHSLAALGSDGVLVLAEPSLSLVGDENRSKLAGAKTLLVVLPKWTVRRDERRTDWIGAAELVPAIQAEAVLSAVVGRGDVIRVAAPSSYEKMIAAPDPVLSGQVQLIKNARLKPLVASSDGVLLGELRDGQRRIWVLSDPDPIENHGIGAGDNAVFAKDMIEGLLAGKDGPLVFDETIHGFLAAPPNLLKFLHEFPFNLVLAQIVAAVALLLMAAMGRFGTPEAPARRLEAGKRELIVNTASLIDHAGHHPAMLRRYVGMMLQDTGRALGAPRQLNEAQLAGWLDKTARTRGLAAPEAVTRIAAAKPGDLGALLAQARAIHQWRKDMLNGIPGRLGDH